MKTDPNGHTRARIRAVASSLPSVPVPSSYWDDRYGLPAGSTARRTGIDLRFRCGAGESVHTLASAAIRQALDHAQLKPRDIGLLIDGSAGHWQPLPGNASCLLEILGDDWSGIPGIDVRNTCLGFIAALDLARALTARHRHILVVCAETPFPGLQHDDPDSAPLFGEGAAAVIVSAGRQRRRYHFDMETFARHRSACEIAGGGLRLPPAAYTTGGDRHYRFAMDGPRVHRIASTHLPPLIGRFRASWPGHARHLWIPHPASGPAVELLRRKLGVPSERFFCTIASHGNMISAGIPHQLALAWKKFGPVSDFILVGTAAGYSQAVMAWENAHDA